MFKKIRLKDKSFMIPNPHKPNLVRFLTYPFFPLNDVGLDWDAKGVI